jgi:periplasmic copper chaperone A
MTFKTILAASAAAFLALSQGAMADGSISVSDPYMRASGAMASSGAAFMVIDNQGSEDDRLIAASSDVAERVELHTHQSDANGVMKMVHVEEGFPISAGTEHVLARGGDHVMFLGLNRSIAQGDVITVTLTFEKAGDVVVEVPVDMERKPDHAGMGHGNMGHGAMGNGAAGQGAMGQTGN